MSKSILIVRKYKGFGGIEHQILVLSESLIHRGWKIFFLTDLESPLEKELSDKGVKVIIKPFVNQIITALHIIKICKNNNIQIIQAHMLNEDFSCRLAKLLCPKLKHVFRVHTYIDCSQIKQYKKNIYHIASFLTSSFVDVYLPINDINAYELSHRSWVRKRKIKVIHDSVRNLQRKKDDYSFPKNRIIAMIANFDDFKGHDVLLEGVRILKERGERVFVHLIGGVPGRGTDIENTKRLNIVKDTIKSYAINDEIQIDGYCSDIPDAIKECGLVVLPSDSEGTPNCLLEGMMLEKIIVASNVGGIPEFVIDGVTGYLHESQNGKAFADALLKVFNESDEKLEIIKKNAKNYVIKNYSIDVLTEDIINVYLSLLR